jgi:hypothetical protein
MGRIRHRKALDQASTDPSADQRYGWARAGAITRAIVNANPTDPAFSIALSIANRTDDKAEVERRLVTAAACGWTTWPPSADDLRPVIAPEAE